MAYRVLVSGTGRMGALVAELVEADEQLELVGQVGIDDVSELDAGNEPQADVVIDFTNQAMLPHLAAYLRAKPAALVSGTTGLGEADEALLAELAEQMPVCHEANFSLGVAMLRKLVSEAAASLDGWDIEIVETHHNQKADAPSGTALALLKAADPKGACKVVNGRAGMVGARTKREIGVHAVRGGTVAGVHEVHLFGADEELTLTHRATSRAIFAHGALAAAHALLGRDAGRYRLDDLV